MKWKIYNACCLYNISAIIVFLVLFARSISGDLPGTDASDIVELVFLLLVVASMIGKNYMGRKLYTRLSNKDVHEPGFGAFFYFLWILNIICFILLFLFALDTFTAKTFSNISWENFRELLALFTLFGFYIFLLSSLYCLIFDITIEKLVRRQYDPAAELLKE